MHWNEEEPNFPNAPEFCITVLSVIVLGGVFLYCMTSIAAHMNRIESHLKCNTESVADR